MTNSEQSAFFEANGYLILPQFYSPAEVDGVDAILRKCWTESSSKIVVDDLQLNKRSLIRDVEPAHRDAHSFKTNDLYLEHPEVRAIALNARLGPLLRDVLLGETPALCNSLNFEHGSQQPDHMDSLYMTPRTQGHLTAIWVALEDCHMDAGPLKYYPGSHLIPPYRFSDGTFHAIDSEMEAWSAYMRQQVEQRGLQAELFPAKKGDVLIWHANLLHGGSPIRDPAKTRKSLVCHYFSKTDAAAQELQLMPMDGGYWIRRPHQLTEQPPAPGPAPASTQDTGQDAPALGKLSGLASACKEEARKILESRPGGKRALLVYRIAKQALIDMKQAFRS